MHEFDAELARFTNYMYKHCLLSSRSVFPYYLYTEFIKMAGVPEQGILGLTEHLFTDFFRSKKNQEYHSRKEKQKT